MVNPLDLRGPEFLVFYCVLGLAITVVVWLVRRNGERGDTPRPLADYLEIAFLRGGAVEAIQVAALTLIDRGALSVEGARTLVAAKDAARRVTKATERAIVTRVGVSAGMSDLLADHALTTAVTAECEPELVRRGLLPDAGQRASRNRLWLWSAGLLALVAALKIAVALSRGRSNIGFLIALAGAFAFVTFVVTHPRLTPSGHALVGDLRTLFSGLKDRASSMRPQSGGTDLALLVAVFGVDAALPVYPEAKRLFPQASASDGGSSDDGSSGSSCGSSSGSSCGGGGGGCGGCGSS
jgi:uncharacterized protein (TIGR04222 family)